MFTSETWSARPSALVDQANADLCRFLGIDRWEYTTAEAAQLAPLHMGWNQGPPAVPGYWHTTLVGDRSLLIDDDILVFTRGPILVRISVHGGFGDEDGFGEEYILNLGRKVNAKLEPPSGSLTLQVSAISKHVQPHNNRRVEVEVSSNTAPVSYDFSIYRAKNASLPNDLGARVFTQVIQSPTGAYTFIWEASRTTAGRPTTDATNWSSPPPIRPGDRPPTAWASR